MYAIKSILIHFKINKEYSISHSANIRTQSKALAKSNKKIKRPKTPIAMRRNCLPTECILWYVRVATSHVRMSSLIFTPHPPLSCPRIYLAGPGGWGDPFLFNDVASLESRVFLLFSPNAFTNNCSW